MHVTYLSVTYNLCYLSLSTSKLKGYNFNDNKTLYHPVLWVSEVSVRTHSTSHSPTLHIQSGDSPYTCCTSVWSCDCDLADCIVTVQL